MTDRLVIIADDLTGAADAAAPWAGRVDVAVLLDAQRLSQARETVISVDTDSRHQDPERAALSVARATADALALGARVYKKIDSTLRGNTAVEVVAALRAAQTAAGPGGERPTVLLCPAFPGTGRSVIDGIVHVDGQALPDGRGDLRALFEPTDVRLDRIGLDALRAGDTAALAAYRSATGAGADIVFVDAQTPADLILVAALARRLGDATLTVGSGGLMQAMALEHAAPADGAREDGAPPAAGAILVVTGSYAPRARQQRARLVANGMAAVSLHAPYDAAERLRTARTLGERLARQDTLLSPDPAERVAREHAAAVAESMAAVGSELLADSARGLRAVVATGGETARALLVRLGVTRLVVRAELEPGVVLSSLPELGDLALVTKAGAFGDADTLVRVRRRLRAEGPAMHLSLSQ